MDFPEYYRFDVSTPIGLFRSRTFEFKTQDQYNEVIKMIEKSIDSQYFSFENQQRGITVIPDTVLKQSVIELVQVQ